MKCPQCDHENAPDAKRCQRCQTLLGRGLEGATVIETPTVGGGTAGTAATGGVVTGWSVPPGTPAEGMAGLSGLQPGALLGGRYEILQLLGEGGMGAVYKARDVELERVVAVKVIRPELVGRAEILQRFKQELILARKVTHKNVIRIFDLGQAGNIKFITMEFVEGSDLKQVLRAKRKLEPKEATEVMLQVSRALEAAHAEGVIHRDLKPQNIMIEQGTGRILVMDFGIARSMESQGMTQTGALMGTPEYMSPEQAKGEKLDHRSDLFTFGIIFYELLTGRSPYKSDTIMGSLMKRLQEPARPPIEADASVPQDLSDLVGKCLQREPAERCQSAHDIVRALEDRLGLTPSRTIIAAPAGVVAAVRHWRWAAAGLAVLVLAVAGLFFFREKSAPPRAGPQKAITVLVADFDNNTGDPVFDGTLEPMFTLALEGASFVSSYRRVDAMRVAIQIQPVATRIDEGLARLVAAREGVNVVVAGSVGRAGEGYAVSVRATDALTGKNIATEEIKASNKEKVLATVGKLAVPIRQALGDATPESAQLAAAETFTTASLEAAHSYAVAQQLHLTGKYDEAIRSYSQAAELDPTFGRAYAGLAVTYANLGQREVAEKYFQMAMARIDRMTEREKARIRGIYYLLVRRDPAKAVEEYTALVKQYPADSVGHAMLAVAYGSIRNMPRALEGARRATEIHPKNLIHRGNAALIAMYAGEFETAGREAQAVLGLNPSYGKAYLALALTQLAQGQLPQAMATYQRLEKVGPWASYATSGLADLAFYEGQMAGVAEILEKGTATDLANNKAGMAANKLATLAEAHLVRGQRGPALAAVDRAVNSSKEEGLLFLAARLYLQLGQDAKARALAADLERRLGAEPQAYAKLIDGEAQLKRGNARDALKLFEEAHKLLDTWIGHFDLGRAYLEAGAFAEAHSEFELCVKRRGEATALFLDEIPTYRFFPPVYYYLGRAQEGLKSAGAPESYKTYLAIKEKGGEDPLVADARKRLARR